jgi:predicted RNA-binding Zn ribbon-like protein
MLPKLRERLEQGFKVRLPKKLFRPFDLPASIRTTIEHAGLSLELSVRPGELRFADAALWYSSRISVSR